MAMYLGDEDLMVRNPKNLIHFPYEEVIVQNGGTHNEVTYTISNNGIITLNGTSTEAYWYRLNLNIPMVEGKTYTISGAYGSSIWSAWRVLVECKNADGTHLGGFASMDGSLTFTTPTGTVLGKAYIYVGAGQTFNNQVFKPMLNEGDIALPYGVSRNWKILAPSINLFDKSLIRLDGTDFAECSESELSADKNTMIARGGSDDTTMEFGYARGWVRGGAYESTVNGKGAKLKKGDVVTVSADFTLIEQGNRSAAVRCYLQSNHPNVDMYDTNARSISETTQRLTWKFTVTDDAVDFYPTFPINSNKVKIQNISVNKVKDYWRVRSGVNMGRNTKNLIPFPYYNNSVTKNGITFTVNDDGTVTANGTATANAEFLIIQNRVPLNPNTQYIISGCPKQSGSNISVYVGGYKDGVYQKEYTDLGRGGYTFTAEEGHDYNSRILIRSGTTVDNVTFKPMLNEGTKALPYFYYD